MFARRFARRVRTEAWAVGFATLLASGSAWATQFVVADATYTHSAQTTMDSHYRVVPASGTPSNWTSPVDYANGSAHVRLEVRTKPNTTTETCFQVCFEATQNYGCTDISKPYTTLGVYEWDTPFSRFYKPGPVPWEKGIVKVALLLKDTKNVKPAPENVGAATSALYMPTDVRVTVTIVSSGSTFLPPGGTVAADAGSPDAGQAADAAVIEAGTGGSDAAAAGASIDADASSASQADDASSSADVAAPAPMPDAAGPVELPPATGSGGSTGTPVAADAAAPIVTPPSHDTQDAAATPPPGPTGAPNLVGNGGSVSASGCGVIGGDAPVNGWGLACAMAIALAVRLRRRSPGRR